MKILTINQPWASAIFDSGRDVENKKFRTTYRGRMLIQSAGRFPLKEYRLALKLCAIAGITAPFKDKVYPLSRIIGVVDLVDCVTVKHVQNNIWASGQWCWLLKNPRLLVTPIEYTKRYGFFDIEFDETKYEWKGIQ